MKKSLTFVASLMMASFAFAQSPVDLSITGQPTITRIKASGEHLSPTLFQFKADAVLNTGFFDGVGLQAVVGAPMSKDSKNDLSVDITKQTAAYITFMNPNLEPDELRFILYVGYASTELETFLKSRDFAVKDTFSGTSYGFSLQQRIMANQPVFLSLDCTRYYKKSDMSIDGCGIGATYAF